MATPADVRAEMSRNQKARWVKGFPASTTFGESSYTVGREGNEYYAYCNRLGIFFVHTTPQIVFDEIRRDMNLNNITGALIHVKTGTITNVRITLDRDNTILEGEGWQTFLNGLTGVVVTITADGCVVRDLGCLSQASDAIVVRGSSAKIQDVWVWSAGRDGILLAGTYAEVLNCLLMSANRNGVHAAGESSNSKIKECYILGAGRDGVAVSGFNIDVGENYIVNTSRYGVGVTTGDVKVYENEITYCLSGGVFMGPNASWSIISDNDIWNVGGDGIHNSLGARFSSIHDNLLYNWTAEPVDNDEPTTTVEDNNCGGDVFNSKGCGFETIMEAVNHQVSDGVIRIPAGIYVEDVVINSDNIVLRGEGQATFIAGSAAPAVMVRGDYCELDSFMATSLLVSGVDTIVFSGADYCRAFNTMIGWSMRDALNIYNSDRFIGEEIRIGQCLRHGIHVEDSLGVLLVKNMIERVSGCGVNLSGAASVSISDNFMQGVGAGAGVCIGAGSDRTTVTCNRITGFLGGAIVDNGTNTVSGLNNIG